MQQGADDLSHRQLQVLLLLTAQSFSIFGCKQYNQSDLVLTIWWCPSVETFLGWLGKESLLRPVCSLNRTLLAIALLHFVLQGQTCLLFWVSIDFLLLDSNPVWWKGHLVLAWILEGVVGLHKNLSTSAFSALVVGA